MKYSLLNFRYGLLLTWNLLKGTNWTMSLEAKLPLGEHSNLSSLSRNSIALKSAPPTPTMMIDMGRREASTIAVRVWSMSVITPSVMMSSTKYCCGWREKTNDKIYKGPKNKGLFQYDLRIVSSSSLV